MDSRFQGTGPGAWLGLCAASNKHKYPDRRAARRAARALHHDSVLRAYHCAHCGNWHIGHHHPDTIRGLRPAGPAGGAR